MKLHKTSTRKRIAQRWKAAGHSTTKASIEATLKERYAIICALSQIH